MGVFAQKADGRRILRAALRRKVVQQIPHRERPLGPLALVLLLALGGLGCEGGAKVLAPAVPPPVSIDVLRAASDTLTLNGYPTIVAPNLWRDFMPASPADGEPLNAMATFYPISGPDF